MAENKANVKVGSRKSQLALIQTNTVIDALKELNPDKSFQVVTMSTTGDKILDSALSKIGAKDLFTKELELALERQEVDFVVHSLKDLPTRIAENLIIGCVFKRDSALDAVVMHPKHAGKKLAELPDNSLIGPLTVELAALEHLKYPYRFTMSLSLIGPLTVELAALEHLKYPYRCTMYLSVIGTSSLRRAAQLQRRFPTFKFENIRGNLNTRLKKLDDDDKYDAIILAEAGLARMGWQDRISQVLSPEECMYAVSQGAMAVECRADDSKTLALLSSIHDQDTALSCVAERAFLKTLEGGCSVPVSVHSTLTKSQITLQGAVFSIDGKQCVVDTITKQFPDEPAKKKHRNGHTFSAIVSGNIDVSLCEVANAVGVELANRLLQTEAKTILETAKQQTAKAVIEEQARKEREAAERARLVPDFQ